MKASTKKTILVIPGIIMMLFGIVSYFIVTKKVIQINTTTFIIVEILGAMILMGQIGWLKSIWQSVFDFFKGKLGSSNKPQK